MNSIKEGQEKLKSFTQLAFTWVKGVTWCLRSGSTLRPKPIPRSTQPLPLESCPCLEAQPQWPRVEDDLTPGISRQNQSISPLFQAITLCEVWGSGGPELPASP